ncbi:DUF2853 family protein [Nigerium massiliense]|uniref:DUF2853 family protein n=1 Tax=Nigerium massiliense TaxID=1522317 RepID=UPI00058DAAEA|nr:DUF2853 family protein [Nigerium massiliense]
MATDWAADVKKHAPGADDAVVAKLVSTYRLVMSNTDTAYVAFGDKEELKTVRENFLKKKLGLTQSDDELDKAIAEVGAELKGVNRRSRITVYYLLADKFGKLGVFK